MGAGADIEVVNQFLSRTLTDEQRDLLEVITRDLEMWDVNGQQVAVGGRRARVRRLGERGHALRGRGPGLPRGRRGRLDARPHAGRGAQPARRGRRRRGADALGGGGHAQAASAALPRHDGARGARAVCARPSRPRSAAAAAGDIASRPVRTVSPEHDDARGGRADAALGPRGAAGGRGREGGRPRDAQGRRQGDAPRAGARAGEGLHGRATIFTVARRPTSPSSSGLLTHETSDVCRWSDPGGSSGS